MGFWVDSFSHEGSRFFPVIHSVVHGFGLYPKPGSPYGHKITIWLYTSFISSNGQRGYSLPQVSNCMAANGETTRRPIREHLYIIHGTPEYKECYSEGSYSFYLGKTGIEQILQKKLKINLYGLTVWNLVMWKTSAVI